jgi:hypothetical protein
MCEIDQEAAHERLAAPRGRYGRRQWWIKLTAASACGGLSSSLGGLRALECRA